MSNKSVFMLTVLGFFSVSTLVSSDNFPKTTRTQKVIVDYYETLNAETMIKFIKLIEKTYRKQCKIIVICDNARYYRNKLSFRFVDKDHYVPQEAPDVFTQHHFN